MMIYAVSDIHGCYDKHKGLLKKINFGPEDMLYVPGDVIDRRGDGFKVMLDMAQRPNVVNLLGNHEAMAMKALPGILRTVGTGGAGMNEEEEQAMGLWFRNGGELSLADFLWLDNEQKKIVWEYMRNMPLYKEVEAGGQKFVLVHGGLENFSPERPLTDYAPHDILWCRPEPDTAYYPDKYVVFGHTPVQLLDDCKGSGAKIYRKGNLIDIDCGCVFHDGRLGCLCLDTMEEYYV